MGFKKHSVKINKGKKPKKLRKKTWMFLIWSVVDKRNNADDNLS